MSSSSARGTSGPRLSRMGVLRYGSMRPSGWRSHILCGCWRARQTALTESAPVSRSSRIASSTCRGVRSGEVGRRLTMRSGVQASSRSSQARTCMKTGQSSLASWASSAGRRKGTSAPAAWPCRRSRRRPSCTARGPPGSPPARSRPHAPPAASRRAAASSCAGSPSTRRAQEPPPAPAAIVAPSTSLHRSPAPG